MSFKSIDIRETARNSVQQVKPTKYIVHDLILMGFHLFIPFIHS